MKSIRSIVLASIGAAALAAIPVACGSYSSNGGSGGSASGGSSSSGGASTSGGNTGSGGSSTDTGGSSAGAGGSSAGAGGSSAGAGGNSAGSGGNSGNGGSTGNGGSSTSTGGSTTPAGGASAGGSSGSGGSTGAGGSSTTALPCDILNKETGNKCVSAHSTVRVITAGYTGPLYELCKGTANTGPGSCKGTKQDIGSKDGYADVDAHNAFCPTGTTCTITKIYDQSGQKNDLEPSPQGGVCGPDKPANAGDLPVKINGHSAYGIRIKPGMGYRIGCSGCTIKTGNGMVTGDNPESMYFITSQKNLVDGCCFDYGNAETSSHDDGNGTMETLYFGGGVVWGTGYGGKPGPWVMADLENGLYAGFDESAAPNQDKNIATNLPQKYDFVTGVLLGDVVSKNSGKGRFALYGGDATNGTLMTLYDGMRPNWNGGGYAPMKKQGSIILGTGGDNSCSSGGLFYEGAISAGPVLSKATVDALQAAIVAAKYGQ